MRRRRPVPRTAGPTRSLALPAAAGPRAALVGNAAGRLRPGTPAMRLACAFMALAAPRMSGLAREGADLFISTHPFASQVLGRLRASGRLDVPAVTYLVDASVHPLWVHPDVDLHLGLHDGAAARPAPSGDAPSAWSRWSRAYLRTAPATGRAPRRTTCSRPEPHQRMALVVGVLARDRRAGETASRSATAAWPCRSSSAEPMATSTTVSSPCPASCRCGGATTSPR